MYISTCFLPLYVVSKIGLNFLNFKIHICFQMFYNDIELCFVPYFGAELETMFILKVYVYIPFINTQWQVRAPLNDPSVISPL